MQILDSGPAFAEAGYAQAGQVRNDKGEVLLCDRVSGRPKVVMDSMSSFYALCNLLISAMRYALCPMLYASYTRTGSSMRKVVPLGTLSFMRI